MKIFQGLECRNLAILAGAGVSLDKPANLLSGLAFMSGVLDRLRPSDLTEYDHNELQKLEKRRPGEFLRFESLMSALRETRLDPTLGVLNCLGNSTFPNRNHFILASLIHDGCIVLTTNFDTLIEQAYRRLNPGDWPPLTVVAYDAEYSDDTEASVSTFDSATLWKLHGSLDRGGVDTRDSIEATLARVSASAQKGKKYDFVRAVLRSCDLVVVGYSGADDFDIVTLLSETRTDRRILWIDYKDVPPTIHSADSIKAQLPAWEIDTIGKERIFFNEDQEGNPIRASEAILLIEGRTPELFKSLHDQLCPGREFPDVEGEFRFGRAYPKEVTEYFDQWVTQLTIDDADRYRLLTHVFASRLSRRDLTAQWVDMRNTFWMLRPKNPYERLNLLVAVFNQGKYRFPTNNRQQSELMKIASDVADLRPQLEPSDLVLAWRLMGCICYLVGDSDEGDEFFQLSLMKAGELNDPQLEFDTLVTWRRFWSDSLGSGNMASSFQAVELNGKQVIARRGYNDHTAEARIAELEQYIDLSKAYRDELIIDLAANLADAIYPAVLELTNRTLRYRRFAINIGDVRGEAHACLRLAHLFDVLNAFDKSRLELLRLEELERVLPQPVPRYSILAPLPAWSAGVATNEALLLRDRVRASMWRDAEPKPKQRKRWSLFGRKG